MVEVDVLQVEAEDEDGQGAAGSCVSNIMANALDQEEDLHVRRNPSTSSKEPLPGLGRSVQPGLERAQISKLIASPRRHAEMREYVKRQDFWRVPHFFRDMEADFDEEEEYIESLQLPDEAPKRRVRLLAQSERELIIQGLRQQFQKATATYLKAAPSSRSKENLEELERIKQDIANLSHPYVFVEA
mmetsp:Transcript_16307/g.35905  ORF Transcript_16307/g.35905 Transcript_16307/m.35905 type:complete len:187 (+) Transcript_16307:70-630(+)